jgi:NADH-quinone oxidoreductase subunit M
MQALQILIIFLAIGTTVISLFPRKEKQGIHLVSLTISVYFFFMCLSFLYFFDTTEPGYQFYTEVPIIPEYCLYFSLGLDGHSLPFLLLTAYIMPICIYAAEPIENDFKDFVVYLLLIELCLTLTFLSTNAFFFYVFFESVLIPMYLLIGK